MNVITAKLRAELSRGTSSSAIYDMVATAIRECREPGGILVDVGCGTGNLWNNLSDRFDRYLGVDIVQFNGFPATGEFFELDLDSGRAPLPDGVADVVASVETIEHLENPRALFRELVRLCKPGGWVIVTTPNQLSMLSKATLILKNQFNAFTDSSYPAHITALLEIDLRRMAKEIGLEKVQICYTCSGRIPGTGVQFPKMISSIFPRFFSDNLMLIGRKSL